MTNHSHTPRFERRLVAAALLALLATGCAVGPDYKRPTTAEVTNFKEAEGWVPAAPADALERGPWWSLFKDPVLDQLQSRVDVSNQNVALAVAAYAQARALVREQRASLFPTVTLDAGATRSRSSGNVTTDTTGRVGNNYQLSIGGSWEPDVWGRLRRTIEGARGAAQASEADLAAARLSAQGALAADYFQLRQADAEIALLSEVVAGYRKSLQIAQNRYDAGVAPHSDVLQAQTQLATTQADLTDLSHSRAVFEHAIAVLVGQTPETFDLAADAGWTATIPQVPAGVPSTLLQRRPSCT